MLKDITLGQFFPGDTLAHKLDPRTKLLVTVLYIVALFTAKSYLAYGLLVLTLLHSILPLMQAVGTTRPTPPRGRPARQRPHPGVRCWVCRLGGAGGGGFRLG